MFDGISEEDLVGLVEKGLAVAAGLWRVDFTADDALQVAAARVVKAAASTVETDEGLHAQVDGNLKCRLHFYRN